MSDVILRLHKRKHCGVAGCDFRNEGFVDAPNLKVSLFEMENLFAGIKMAKAPYNKGDSHKHHMVRESWVEVLYE